MTKRSDRLPIEPDAEDIRAAWLEAEAAEDNARELRGVSDEVLFRAYQTGWHIADIATAVGLDPDAPASRRRLYRRLQRPFQQAAEKVAG